MPYNTAALPQSIRKQVEDFIEFLLWKEGNAEQSSSEPDSLVQRQRKIQSVVQAYQDLPTLDDRQPEEILYDEYGLSKAQMDRD